MTLQKKTKEPPYPPFLKRYTPFLWFLWLQRERKKKQNRRGQWGKMLWLWLSTDRKGKPGGVPPILMVQIYQRIDDDWTILTTTSQRSNKSFINENKSMRKDGKRLWIDGARTSDPPLSAFTNTDRYLHLWVEIVVGGHGTIQTCSNATALVQFSVE